MHSLKHGSKHKKDINVKPCPLIEGIFMFFLQEIQTSNLFGFFIKKNNVSVMPRRYSIRKAGLQFPSVCAMLINGGSLEILFDLKTSLTKKNMSIEGSDWCNFCIVCKAK